jgi:energy-coupling factor transporter ATP-binding protein EcfA2
MLKRLHLKNFTVFADADFEFSPGLNVLVGTNGTGKSHVLRVGYATELTRIKIGQEIYSGQVSIPLVNNATWTATLYKLLPEVFLSTQLASLIRWDVKDVTTIRVDFGLNEELIVELKPASMNDEFKQASIKTLKAPEAAPVQQPVFIPAKEILTLNWILPVSEQLVVPIERNYLDLLTQLRRLPLRHPEVISSLKELTTLLGGDIEEEEGRYYLLAPNGRRTNIGMLAEGLRKFGILQKLLANGSLTKNSTLYWDEPEANLNPALLRKLAAILAELARQGFQIILATHSMSLLKEFHILSREPNKEKLPIKYFGLNAQPGEATTVVATDDFKYLPDVVALDVELEQADALEDIFAKEATQFHADNH